MPMCADTACSPTTASDQGVILRAMGQPAIGLGPRSLSDTLPGSGVMFGREAGKLGDFYKLYE